MSFIKKINKVAGHSSGIILDKKYKKKLKLEDGDYVEVVLKKIIGRI